MLCGEFFLEKFKDQIKLPIKKSGEPDLINILPANKFLELIVVDF